MEIIKTIVSRKIIIVIFLVTIIWTIFSSIFYNKVSFSVVTFNVRNNFQSQLIQNEPDTHVVFMGQFQAKDNNLGLIILPFNPHSLINHSKDEFVTFSFKEKKDKTWSFRKEYNIRIFDSQSTFAFGFPLISNSKNKMYQFELASTVAGKDNIEIKKNDNFITGYQYSRQEIKRHLVEFMFNKIIGSLTDSEFQSKVIAQIILMIPFILSLFFLFSKFKKISFHYKIKKTPFHFKVLFYYFKHIKAYAKLINSRFTFMICLVLILLWLLIIPFSLGTIQNLLNVCVYFLLVVGCIQIFFESRENEKAKH